jgi:hypothetical protein
MIFLGFVASLIRPKNRQASIELLTKAGIELKIVTATTNLSHAKSRATALKSKNHARQRTRRMTDETMMAIVEESNVSPS